MGQQAMTTVTRRLTETAVGLSIPFDWAVIPGKALFQLEERPVRDEDEIVTAFRDGMVTLRGNRRTEGFTNAVQEIGYQGIRRGDLVIHGMDGFAGAIGVSDSDGKASPVVHAYTPMPGVDARYYAYVLRTLARSGFIASLAKGIRERSTSFDAATFRALRLPVPPSITQRSIADYLDAETVRIDAVIEKKRRMVELLEEREFAALSVLLVPHGVSFVRLGFVALLQTGLTVDGQRDAGPTEVTRPYLRVANVQPGWLELDSVTDITVSSDLAQRCALRSGDVLMTEGGDLDKLGRGTVWRDQLPGALHQNHVFAVRPVPNRLDPDFLSLLTRTAHARAYFESTGTRTTNLASTNSSKILDLPIPQLEFVTQQSLVAQASREVDLLRNTRGTIGQQIALLTEHRQALITAAVTGELPLPGGPA